MSNELSAGRELDAAVAVAAFGWRWFMHVEECRVGLFPPVSKEWQRWNYSPKLFSEVGESAGDMARFSDWDRCGGRRTNGGRNIEFLPYFSTDPAACALAKVWLFERGLGFTLDWEKRTKGSEFAFRAELEGVGEEEDVFSEYGSTEEHAVARLVLAVAAATGGTGR